MQGMGYGLGEVAIQGTYHKAEGGEWPSLDKGKTTTIAALEKSYAGVITASIMRIDSINQSAELNITISCQPDQFS